MQNETSQELLSATLVALGNALAYEEVHQAPGARVPVHLPLAVFLTGLPEFRDYASSLVGATFARRLAPELLDPLGDDSRPHCTRSSWTAGRCATRVVSRRS